MTHNSVKEEVSNRDAKHVRVTSLRHVGGVNKAKQSSPPRTELYFNCFLF